MINLDLRENDLKKINLLLIILFLIQLPASAIHYYFYGISESTHGIYGRGGGLTTIIPLVALGYIGGFYIFNKAKKVYMLLGLMFIFYGIVGAKAALLFLYPLSFIALYYFGFIKGKKINILKHAVTIIMIIICSVVVSGVVIKLNPRLNPEKKVGGTIDFSYAYEYAKNYTTAKHPLDPDIAIGRYSTTELVIKQIWEDGFQKIFFGYGPGAITPTIFGYSVERKLLNIKKSYGLTAFTYILLEYGLLGTISIIAIFSIFVFRCTKWFKFEQDNYWKAFAFGSLFFSVNYILIFFSYNKVPIAGDIIPLIFFYTMSITHIKLKEIEALKISNFVELKS
jgi:hypothetical protein